MSDTNTEDKLRAEIMSDLKLKDIKSFTISPNGLAGRIKSPIVWGNWDRQSAPLFYIRKPKWLSDKDFNRVVVGLDISITLKPTPKTGGKP